MSPVLGQGLNAALEDVVVFALCLEQHQGSVDTALPAYNRARLPDVRAIMLVNEVVASADAGLTVQVKPFLNQSMYLYCHTDPTAGQTDDVMSLIICFLVCSLTMCSGKTCCPAPLLISGYVVLLSCSTLIIINSLRTKQVLLNAKDLLLLYGTSTSIIFQDQNSSQ